VPALRFRYSEPGTLDATERLGRPLLFLDRDGVINDDHGYVATIERCAFVEGIFEVVRHFRAIGFTAVVITNQAGIARGYYTENQFLEFTGWLHRTFAAQKAPLAATYYCPFHPDGTIPEFSHPSELRKPQPGMLLQALADFGANAAECVLVGDSPTDIEAARRAGVGGAWLLDRSATQPRPGVLTHLQALTNIV
jgi:D-glycero-D-manno-heptose 1,7-bisphosphate phosphatase